MTEHGTCSYCGSHIEDEDASQLTENIESHESSCEENPNLVYG